MKSPDPDGFDKFWKKMKFAYPVDFKSLSSLLSCALAYDGLAPCQTDRVCGLCGVGAGREGLAEASAAIHANSYTPIIRVSSENYLVLSSLSSFQIIRRNTMTFGKE